jgi:hypothetical protein
MECQKASNESLFVPMNMNLIQQLCMEFFSMTWTLVA